MRAVLAVLCALTLARGAAAQTHDLADAGLPRDVAAQLQAIIDDPRTLRLNGPATIEATRTVPSSVAGFDGPITVAGAIEGDLIVVNGDLVLEPGARVAGSVTVVGGSLSGAEQATLGGTATVYGEGFSLIRRGRRVLSSAHARDRDERDERADRAGGAELRVAIAESYNRVEGLPVQIGPDIWTGGSWPLHLQAFAIWRTAAGSPFDTERMGYLLRAEQLMAGRAVRIGGTLRSTVQPIERWSLSDTEATFAAALFHEDFRDYFEREGWSAYVRVAPRGSPLDLKVEYRDEEHATAGIRDPWTLFDRNNLWRPQPFAAEGAVRLLSATAELDFRRGSDLRTRGWLVRADADHRLRGTLVIPAIAGALDPVRFDRPFTSARLDVRRFQRAGRDAVLALRAVGGGALDRRPLPPQFQHALGGPGSLPGYAPFDVDCGARGLAVARGGAADEQAFFTSYGCDRFALFQAEYRGGFDFRFGGDARHDGHGGWRIDGSPNWIVFFDAARGWSFDDNDTLDTGTLYDVGAGLLVGGVGVYGAVPLTGDERDLRLFVRLGPRF